MRILKIIIKERGIKMKTSLVVMAAGMGSRFGGLKQMEPVADNGSVILDFSVYDALKAGFDEIVFIIKDEIAEDFKRIVGSKIEKKAPVKYVYQDVSCLPEGRTKPFGTAHAILCCKDVVKNPFAVLNADDYYGPHAFQDIHDELVKAGDFDFSMVSYELANTLSKNGSVARGVCEIENGYLKDIVERTKIEDFRYTEDGETWIDMPKDTKVSMNLWGLTPAIFDVIEEQFEEFKKTANLMKDEFFIPLVIDRLVKAGKATVKVINNSDKWYGITYREDLPEIKAALKAYIEEGMYDEI